MIYKMKLTDSSDSMTFDLLEVPIVDKDIEGAVDNTTLDGNVYTDYLWLKKQYMQKWAILCDTEYTQLRGFYTRQFENATIPTYRLYYGTNNFLDKTVSGEYITTNVSGIEQAPITDISLLGNTEQTTYSGKNLLIYPYKHGTSTVDGVTFTDNGDGSITVNGTSTASTQSLWYFYENTWNYNSLSFELEAGTYTFKGLGVNNVGMACNFYFSDNTNEYFYIGQNDVTKTITQKARLNIRLVVSRGVTVNNVTIYPQIELGSTATTYEPYVGGIPAPNPEFPMPISTVTGEQTVKITGKNLLNAQGGFSNKIINSAGGESVNNHYALFDGFIVMSPSTQYTLSLNSSVNIIFVAEYDSAKTLITRDVKVNSSSYTFTTTATTKFARVFFNYDDSTTVTQTIIDGLNIQLELGSTATAYEPYQGQSYEVNLGKNLFDKNGANGKYQATLSITSESIKTTATNNNTGYVAIAIPNSNNLLGKSCTISYNAQASVGVARTALYCSSSSALASVLGSYIIRKDGNGDQTISFTFPSAYETGANCFVLLLYIQSTSSITAGDYATYSNIQLEAGSQATAYAPYFTPIELAKIGTYQDRIYKSDGKWYIEKQVGKVVYTGASSENWQYSSANQYFSIPLADFQPPSSNGMVGSVISDHFSPASLNSIYSGTDSAIGLHATAGTLWTSYHAITSVADFKTWLASHPTTVYYALATPTDTEITDETLIAQLDALEATKLFLGMNNITTETENEQPTMNIKYTEIYDRETDVISTTAVRLTLTDDGVINNCGCRQNVQLTMRETVS